MSNPSGSVEKGPGSLLRVSYPASWAVGVTPNLMCPPGVTPSLVCSLGWVHSLSIVGGVAFYPRLPCTNLSSSVKCSVLYTEEDKGITHNTLLASGWSMKSPSTNQRTALEWFTVAISLLLVTTFQFVVYLILCKLNTWKNLPYAS